MQGKLYSSDGPLLSEGSCEVAADGITMVAERWHATPQVGGPPATLVLDDGRAVSVAVAEIRVLESDEQRGPTEAYRLIALEGDGS